MTVIAGLRKAAAIPARSRRVGRAGLALAIAFLSASPASAQLGASFGIESNYRHRGYSLSSGDPAASAQLTYDHPSGAYFALAGLARLDDDDPRFMGVLGNLGYARRLSRTVTIDVGILRSQIRRSRAYADPHHYTEIYAGAAVGRFVGRLYYSPDYRRGDVSTLYGELEAGFEPAENWRLSGHVGSLLYLTAARYGGKGSMHHDWRITAARQFGRFEIHSAVSGGGAGDTHYGYRVPNKKAALTAGASVSF